MTHPYKGLPDYQLHREGVTGKHPSLFDPVVGTKFSLLKDDSIATMGSCFAQHLSKWLSENGYNFLTTEPSNSRAGGLFSANYGNVYSVAQALQLFQFAFQSSRPSDETWITESGNHIDPLRPSVTQPGFESARDLLVARDTHYEAVRNMFVKAKALVFTLGLTEAWRRKSDQAILPSAPGVIAGIYSPAEYEFLNFTYDDVYNDLTKFINSILQKNESVKIILTVSPIPLAATFVNRHVAVSSMASKAILRAVVEAVVAQFQNVDYFPSFEIFYTPGVGSAYFESDLRHATSSGVSHAMRVFSQHFFGKSSDNSEKRHGGPTPAALLKARHDVWCDEDLL
jgi:hypothetical protein